ncbi:MAG: DUF87 domain-containing protein [Anaerolineae bacterium]|nr:DUF87 domain-containing protein [Anaerolineae bacterium]
MKTNGKFFIGQDVKSEDNILYDPDDLTTHAMVVGMTGSGKTGLCIDLLEEAALNNIPSLMIDPKGDITNTLLHFPDLLPADFQPWVNPDEARRDGKTVEQAAEDTAKLWSGGLKKWGIGKKRIQALKDSAHFAVFTPGSDAGIPVSILASLQAPDIAWKGNEELLRERISGTATALLGLVGMDDIDPVRSREHILLANLFEHAWSKGKDLDLGELILQTQTPPIEKLGVFELEQFFPKKERFELAMLLNNILAAPTFQTWIEGQPLDIDELLYGPDGRPRHSVFYIAHLNDAERMFFVTLLYAAVETWMRAQSGSTSLRAIVYFDEIFGYMPPVANPASKTLMLRMLKQGRAFGVAQVLVTQNPVDLDYKGLSNTGTWMIGKLQTDRDKERLLDGLEGAAAGNMNRKSYDKLVSALDKREFLLHNVHEKKPAVFRTRWAMNYLAGPLTRTHIPALNELAGAEAASVAKPKGKKKSAKKKAAAAGGPVSTTRPAVPTGAAEYFLPNNLTLSQAYKAAGDAQPSGAKSQGLIYRPTLLAQADIRYMQRKYDLDHEQKLTALLPEVDKRGVARWEDFPADPVDARALDRSPSRDAQFAALEAPLSEAKLVKSMEKDFVDWAYREAEIQVWANEELKLYAGPETSESAFQKQCAEAADEERLAEVKKLKSKYKTKLNSLEKKLSREKRELSEDEAELSQRKMEELGTHAENVIGLFTGSRRRVSTSLTKRRMTAKAKADVEESIDTIAELESDMAELAEEIEADIDDIEARWEEVAADVTQIGINPMKKDILVELFGVAWMPYHLVEAGGRTEELPGYGSGK